MFASGSATLTGTFVHTGQRRINPARNKSNSMIIEPSLMKSKFLNIADFEVLILAFFSIIRVQLLMITLYVIKEGCQ